MRIPRGFTVCLLLALIGLGLSVALFIPHLGLMRGELVGGFGCGGHSVLFNCHAVTASPWGQFLGVPLALWGFLGYLGVAALALLGRQGPEWEAPAALLVFLAAVLFVVLDAALLAVMALVIRYFCPLCLATYAVNLLLLFMAWRSLGQPAGKALAGLGGALGCLMPSTRRPAAWLFWGAVLAGAAGVAGVHAATAYVSRGTLGNLQGQLRAFVQQRPRVSVETSGDPSHGPIGAPIQVVEFSDFHCPSCQRAAQMNTVMFAGHRKDVRFVFKNYPLDTSCNPHIERNVHPGACQLAAAAECAHLQGKFWRMHDKIFEKGHDYRPEWVIRDADAMGLDLDRFKACLTGEGLEAVKRDIAEGAKIGVTSTPTYIMNGVPMAGGMTPVLFEDMVTVLKQGK